MQLIRNYNRWVRFLPCVIDIYRKYALVIPITNAFQEILDESGRKPNEICQMSKFYNRSMKSWLHDNNIEMYSTCNNGKSINAERWIKVLKNKIYSHITVIEK